MKTIQDHKKDATLNKAFRYDEGVMTRREWLNMWMVKGATVKETSRRNLAAEQKLEQWLYDNRDDISGNMNWPPTKRYYEKKAELAAGIFKTEYSLHLPNCNTLYDITKTEYDYFNNMALAEDLATEKSQLSEDKVMAKEFEFAAKYF